MYAINSSMTSPIQWSTVNPSGGTYSIGGTATLTGLLGNQAYWVQVRATNGAGQALLTSAATPAVTKPNAVTSISYGTTTINSVQIIWNKPTEGDGNGITTILPTYSVQYSTSSIFSSPISYGGSITGSNPYIANLTGLTTGQAYYVKITTIGLSFSTVSDIIVIQSPGAIGDITFNTPSDSTTLPISWTRPSGPIETYTIIYSTSQDMLTSPVTATTLITGSSTLSTTLGGSPDSPLVSNQTYYVQIQAKGPGGSGIASNPQAGTTKPGSSVSNITYENLSSTSLKINWNKPSGGNSNISYVLKFSSNSGLTSPQDGSTVTGSNPYTSTISGLTTKTQYYFRITASGAGGSTDTSIITIPAPGTVEVITQGDATQTTLPISWNTPTGGPIQGYEVYYSSTLSNVPVPGATLSTTTITGTSTTLGNAPLTPNEIYYIKIRAYGPGGIGSLTTVPQQAITDPAPVTFIRYGSSYLFY